MLNDFPEDAANLTKFAKKRYYENEVLMAEDIRE